MRGVNKAILIGRLGKDPDVVNFDSGSKKVSFPLATSDSYKNRSGERVETTEWHNIVIWGKLADIAEQYLRKGDPIYLEGKIETRNYDDKDGNKRYITEIRTNSFTMLGSKDDNNSQNQGRQNESEQQKPANKNTGAPPDDISFDDDLPF